jgi:hypothetical protein
MFDVGRSMFDVKNSETVKNLSALARSDLSARRETQPNRPPYRFDSVDEQADDQVSQARHPDLNPSPET